jgi:hypothetical protein
MKPSRLLLSMLASVACQLASGEVLGSRTPAPLPNHPGNIFLAGEDVVVAAPPRVGHPLHLLDYDDKKLIETQAKDGRLSLGRLPVGFYRLQQEGESNWISLAVLAPLGAPTPPESPVALDVAMAWFYPKESRAAAANLCALAGVNWVRDRLAWGEMQPKREVWANPNRYDETARVQSQAGLRVLQVNHSTPSWATSQGRRFPPDLRDAYRFYREMARRWQGQVLAFEPWNEADISMFGGHTGSEMASLQKASYLGLKAGNPQVIACLNVFAMHNHAQLADLQDNAAWPYFDTFNLHHYAPFDEYPRLYADFRAVSAGKPLWVSECALPVKWSGAPALEEPTVAESRVLAERVAKVFACSLHEGSTATFYFMLPHYVEGQTQFGLLRRDLTPRPGYVALAAVGRLLADAKPLGRLQAGAETTRVYLFHARPGGRQREVLVAWTTRGETTFTLPVAPEELFDHLGREVSSGAQVRLTTAPLFAVLPEASERRLSLIPPPAAPTRLAGTPSPVVLQASWPEEETLLAHSAYRIRSDQNVTLPLFVYNFGEAPAVGRLSVAAPDGWQFGALERLELAPQSRAELRLSIDCRKAASPRLTDLLRVTGDFGPAGQAVLAVRLMPEPHLLTRKPGRSIPDAADPARWETMIAGGGKIEITAAGDAVQFEAAPQGPDKWVYPRLALPRGLRAPQGALGLACTLQLLEGSGQFRAIFDEENGSGYVTDLLPAIKPGQTIEVAAFFEQASYGAGWSKPDPNQRLNPDQIASLKIGCNTKAGRVKFAVSKVRWLLP